MGYTHTYKHEDISRDNWNNIVADCRELYENMPAHSTSSGGYYEDKPLVIDGCERGRKRSRDEGKCMGPVLGKREIWFNGTDPKHGDKEGKPELACETFVLFPKKSSDEFPFCKTRRHPYDLMVQACLLVAKYHVGHDIKIHSDGTVEEWKPAFEFVERVLGYTPESIWFKF